MKKTFFRTVTVIMTIILMSLVIAKASTWTINGFPRSNIGLDAYVSSEIGGANSFWAQNPSNGDIIKALYGSGNERTVYTRQRGGGSSRGYGCNVGNMNVVNLSAGINTIPNTLSQYTIYVLNTGNYIATNPIILSGQCIGVVASGTVSISNNFIFINDRYNIIDGINSNQNNVIVSSYTNTGNINITVSNNYQNQIRYYATGDIAVIGGGFINGNSNIPVQLIGGEGSKKIVVELGHDDTFMNHYSKTVVIDTTIPTFTANTISNIPIVSGQVYNTGVVFTFADTNLSGAKINQDIYTNQVVSDESPYLFTVTDKAGNTTGITFNIDRTPPACSRLMPTTGSIITGQSIDFNRNCFDSFSGISGYVMVLKDASLNTISTTNLSNTASTFTFTGETNTYNWQLIITDKAGNVYTTPLQLISFYKPLIGRFIPIGNFYQNKYFVSGSQINVLISGNKEFYYTFTGNITSPSNQLYQGGTISNTVQLAQGNGDRSMYMNYWTGTQSGSTSTVNYYVDQQMPIITTMSPTSNIVTNQQVMNFYWGATDTGGIAYYNLYLGTNIIYSGLNTSFTATGLTTGIYNRKLKVFDYAGNSTGSTVFGFTIDNSYPQILGVTDGSYYRNSVTPIINGANSITLNGLAFNSGTPITGDGYYNLRAGNMVGNVTGIYFWIDTVNPIISLTSPVSGTNFSGNNSITFIRNVSELNLSGYFFELYGNGGYYYTGVSTVSNQILVNNLVDDVYTRKVTARDKANNTAISATNTLTIRVPFTGSIAITGTATIGSQVYANNAIGLQLYINKGSDILITGDILGGTILSGVQGGSTKISNITLSPYDGLKRIYVTLSTGTDVLSQSFSMMVDSTAPTIPTINVAASNTGSFTIAWSASTDTGAGVKQYLYNINSGSTVVKSGVVTSTSVVITNMDLANGTYTATVQARDYVGNASAQSASSAFTYAGVPDTTPDSISFDKITDASLDTQYTSSTITVTGLSLNTQVMAYLDDGKLYINGYSMGTTGMVKNGDQISIKLYSSEDYSDTISTVLTLGNQTAIFKITTKSDGDSSDDNKDNEDDLGDIVSLTTSQKLQVSVIYNALSDLYSDSSKKSEFMVAFKAMIKDKVKELQDDNADEVKIGTLQYLYQLIDDDYSEDSSTHTAPNGKVYTITYDSSKGYTSPKFVNKNKYFSTLAALHEYIDANNKAGTSGGTTTAQYTNVDQSRSSAAYKAPNGKSYSLLKLTNGRYGSYTFQTAKTFTTLKELKAYINKNNPKK